MELSMLLMCPCLPHQYECVCEGHMLHCVCFNINWAIDARTCTCMHAGASYDVPELNHLNERQHSEHIQGIIKSRCSPVAYPVQLHFVCSSAAPISICFLLRAYSARGLGVLC